MLNMLMLFKTSLYSLRKSRRIFSWAYKWYRKKGKRIPDNDLKTLEDQLHQLDQALVENNREEADKFARAVETYGRTRFKKNLFEGFLELVIALIVALGIAIVVRQMWFEPNEIPTGSMRPTFEEQDQVLVTKTNFGLNIPLQTAHFYFDPSLVQRTSTFVFSADGLPMSDTNTTYFWIIPYKKRLVKRCMGKPGDTLYFYGGKLYVIDSDGNPLEEFLDSPWLKKIEYIPFITFEGEISNPSSSQILFYQMHKPIGRLSLLPTGALLGEVFNGREWVKDQPQADKKPHDKILTYCDFWGFRNFAMTRLLTRKEVEAYTPINVKEMEKAPLYLELRHHPSLTYPSPTFFVENGIFNVMLTPLISIIPLQEKHLKALMDNMYTARFIIKNGRAKNYSVQPIPFGINSPEFPGVPDGTYEFYYGKAYRIGWGGISSPLPPNHPLYSSRPENIQKLYNLGIQMNLAFTPHSRHQLSYPRRYAYFREGDLYLLGASVLKKDDPTLVAFNASEEKRQKLSSDERPYIAFKDDGPPIKEGKWDTDFIRTFGITLPEGHYMALGDNHSMSGDSRVFGFVPQANIRGAPAFIFWPPGPRWGSPPQKPYPFFTTPRMIVYAMVVIILAIWYTIHHYRSKKRQFKKIHKE